MIGSPLATAIIPAYKGNYTAGRAGHAIRKITIHHMAARWTAARCGQSFQVIGREGSTHYGIGYSGEIAQYVSESDTAWADGNRTSNQESVTIESADVQTGAPWDVTSETLESLIKLCADIAIRNGLGLLVKGQNITWHSMYQATACPGDGLRAKMDYICAEANKIISANGIPTQKVTCSYQVYASGRWLPIVSGHDTGDKNNGYAGNFAEPIKGIFADASAGNLFYKAHLKGGGWLPEVKNREDYAGNLARPIDAVMICSDVTRVHYRAHTISGGWLPEVTGYSETDAKNGYAGIIGKEIDGLLIYAEDIANKTESVVQEISELENPTAEETDEPTAENPSVEESQENIALTESEKEENLEQVAENKNEEKKENEENEEKEEKRSFIEVLFSFLLKIFSILRGKK